MSSRRPVNSPPFRTRSFATGLAAMGMATMLTGASDLSTCPQTLSRTFHNHSELKWILFDTSGKLNARGTDAVRLGCTIYPHTDAAQGIVRPEPVKKPPSGPTRANGPVS